MNPYNVNMQLSYIAAGLPPAMPRWTTFTQQSLRMMHAYPLGQRNNQRPAFVAPTRDKNRINILTLPTKAQKLIFQAMQTVDLVIWASDQQPVRQAIVECELQRGPQEGYSVVYGTTNKFVMHFTGEPLERTMPSWPAEPNQLIDSLMLMMNTFPAPVTELNLAIKPLSPDFITEFGEQIGVCGHLILHGYDDEVTTFEMNRVLDLVRVEDQLTIATPITTIPNLQNVHAPRLAIHYALTVEVEDVVGYNQKYVLLQNTTFDTMKIKALIERLRTSNDRIRTEWFEIQSNNNIDLNLIVVQYIAEKLASAWNANRRDAYFSQIQGKRLADVDLRLGCDIQAVNGTLVTILKSTSTLDATATSSLHIVVWKNRFPNAQNIANFAQIQPKILNVDDKMARIRKTIEENDVKMHENLIRSGFFQETNDALCDENHFHREHQRVGFKIAAIENQVQELTLKMTMDRVEET